MSKYQNVLLPPMLVNTPDAMDDMLYRLQAASVVSVDTEANSLYAYTERVCLIQFTVPGQDYLVDPLALEDLSMLGPVFADPEIVKIFHAAEYDVMSMRRDFQFDFVNLFDTMIASRIVGWPRFGLAALLEEYFGVQTDKRMQRTNWGKRPLSKEQLEYARLDSHFLLSLRSKLLAELEAQGRLEEASFAFERVAQSQWKKKSFSPDGFWRIKRARDLEGQELAILRELFIYREGRAQELDRPPFKVMNNSVLLSLSQRAPRSVAELGRIHGLPRRMPSRERRALLDVVEQGLNAPIPTPPRRKRRDRADDETVDRYEALRVWRRGRAESRGVEPDVILPNRVLRDLAARNPHSPAQLSGVEILNDWERREYGREIVALLRRQARFR
jgi:ribonuclease D